MLPGESVLPTTLFVFVVAVVGTVVTCLLALRYLRRVRLERPPIGTFNRRDIVFLFGFIIGLPLLYLVLPLTFLLVVLGITFASALSMGLRPLLGPTGTWIVVGLLIGANVWMSRTILGTVLGWQIFWLENSVLIVLAAVTVANLYVQGGMRVKHVAWFALILAVYDAIFVFVWPITNLLAQRFIGWPLNPSVGFRMGLTNASIGLGDLLIYSLFVISVFKAYGPKASRVALAVAVAFGAVIPALSPLLFNIFLDARTDLFVPAQVAFGPVAFLCYLWLRRRYGRERTMVEFLAGDDGPRLRRTPAAAAPARRSIPSIPAPVDPLAPPVVEGEPAPSRA